MYSVNDFVRKIFGGQIELLILKIYDDSEIFFKIIRRVGKFFVNRLNNSDGKKYIFFFYESAFSALIKPVLML